MKKTLVAAVAALCMAPASLFAHSLDSILATHEPAVSRIVESTPAGAFVIVVSNLIHFDVAAKLASDSGVHFCEHLHMKHPIMFDGFERYSDRDLAMWEFSGQCEWSYAAPAWISESTAQGVYTVMVPQEYDVGLASKAASDASEGFCEQIGKQAPPVFDSFLDGSALGRPWEFRGTCR